MGRYALLFCLFVSPPSLPANSFTSRGRTVLLFWIVSPPSLLTSMFYWLVSSPSVPTYPLTSLDRRYVLLLFY